jgi:hypothetical protein
MGCYPDSPTSRSNERARREWVLQEKAVLNAVEGSGDTHEFGPACEFFARTAGIKIAVHETYGSLFPAKETKGDLERAREWYEKNADRLYWDEKAGRVAARPPTGPLGAVWWQHEKVLISLVFDEGVSGPEVAKAHTFFRNLVGIDFPYTLDHRFGPRPVQGTYESLLSLRSWYEMNGADLRLDRGSGEPLAQLPSTVMGTSPSRNPFRQVGKSPESRWRDCLNLRLRIRDRLEGTPLEGSVLATNRCQTRLAVLTGPMNIRRLDFNALPEASPGTPMQASLYIYLRDSEPGDLRRFTERALRAPLDPNFITLEPDESRSIPLAGGPSEEPDLNAGDYGAVLVTWIAPTDEPGEDFNFFNLNQTWELWRKSSPGTEPMPLSNAVECVISSQSPLTIGAP